MAKGIFFGENSIFVKEDLINKNIQQKAINDQLEQKNISLEFEINNSKNKEKNINTKKFLINKNINLISRLNINRGQKSNNSNKNNSNKNNSNKTNTYESVLRKLNMVRNIDDRKFNRNTVKTDVLNKLYTMQSRRINKILHNGIETFNDYNDVVSDTTININLSDKENTINYDKSRFKSIIEKTVSKLKRTP